LGINNTQEVPPSGGSLEIGNSFLLTCDLE